MSASYYSFWLVPQSPDLDYLQGIVNTLAKQFGTVSFCPHVTLYSGAVPATVDLQKVCAHLSARPVELAISQLGYESRFSKTLYIQLRPSSTLAQLVSRLVAAIPNAQAPTLDPHVSLLYCNGLDTATKQTLSNTINLSQSTIRFDHIQVISAPQNFETQTHVSKLRCVHSQRLTKS